MPRNRRDQSSRSVLRVAVVMLAVLIGTADPAPAFAQTAPSEEAARVQSELEAERERSRALEAKTRTLSQELEAMRMQLVTAARDAQSRETLIANLELQITELQQETKRRQVVLGERHQQLTGTLSALTGLSADAPRAFFLYPGAPLEAVRGSMLLLAAIPALGQRAAVLREDLAALAAVQQDMADKLARLNAEGENLTQDRAEIEALLEKKRALYQETSEKSRQANDRLRELAEKSASLKELMAALEAERMAREDEEARLREETEMAQAAAETASVQTTESQADAAQSETATQLAALARLPTERPDGIRAFPDDGVITAPAVGTLTIQYGQETDFGQTSKGIVLETLPGGTVLSPFDGKVAFAGPFRDLGRVLIIEHDGGYHTVLAGFERIDVASGNWILAGEPIGIMPQTNISAPGSAFGAGTGSGTRPKLYMELRRGGQPVNPLRWITASSIRMNG